MLLASPLFQKIQNAKKKIVCCRGGTRSSKTMSLCLAALSWLLGSNEEGVWSICRKTLPALKATAYRDFLTLMQQAEVTVEHNRSEMTFQVGNRTVEFHSLDDQQKIRSRKRKYLHLVEANEIDFDLFTQLMLRTEVRAYLDYNPDRIEHWLNVEIEQKRAQLKGDVEVIVSTYRDNPFLTNDQVDEIEYLRKVDPELWAIFGEGNYGKITGLIFKQHQLIDKFPEIDYFIGLDWGFSHDPTAAVRVAKEGNRLYLDEILYEKMLINSEIGSKLKKYPALIVADSAEPKSIEDLQRTGLRIMPSVKGPDSIRSGLGAMLEYELFVTSHSINLIKELNHYRRDAQGDPIDTYNHAIDAARYVVQTKLRKEFKGTSSITINRFNPAVTRVPIQKF